MDGAINFVSTAHRPSMVGSIRHGLEHQFTAFVVDFSGGCWPCGIVKITCRMLNLRTKLVAMLLKVSLYAPWVVVQIKYCHYTRYSDSRVLWEDWRVEEV
jgi:hypothetical protein